MEHFGLATWVIGSVFGAGLAIQCLIEELKSEHRETEKLVELLLGLFLSILFGYFIGILLVLALLVGAIILPLYLLALGLEKINPYKNT